MLVYGVVFGLFCINAFMENKSSKYKHMNLMIYVCFILVYAFRKNIGHDWVTYKYYFDNLASSGLIEKFNFEIGYKLLNSVVHIFFNSFWSLVFIVGIFNGILFWKATSKYTKSVGIVMLLSLYYIFYPSLEAFRQSICFILFYYSLEYIETNEKKYLLINLIGVLFHRSSFVAILFYIFNKNKKARIIIIICLVFFRQFEKILVPLIKLFPNIYAKYNWYFNIQIHSSIFTLKLIEYSLILLFYLFLIKNEWINDREKVLANLVFLGFLFQVSLSQISNVVYRLTYYTDMGIMLSYVFIYDRIKSSLYKYLYVLFLTIYIFLRFYRLFPFHDPGFIYHF